MPEFKDITGNTFGRWTVMRRADNRVTPNGCTYTVWHCKCVCGTERDVLAQSLLNGKTQSCGCMQRERAKTVCRDNFIDHGCSKTRLYKIWIGIKKRCYNRKSKNYPNYGGRGIEMCDLWKDDFMSFSKWALESGYNDDMSIDRIDVDGDYSPDNCRWTDSISQNNNRRSNVVIEYNGERHTIAEWSRILGVSYAKLYKDIHNKGKSISEILSA